MTLLLLGVNDVQYLCKVQNVFLKLNAIDHASESEKELKNFHFTTVEEINLKKMLRIFKIINK